MVPPPVTTAVAFVEFIEHLIIVNVVLMDTAEAVPLPNVVKLTLDAEDPPCVNAVVLNAPGSILDCRVAMTPVDEVVIGLFMSVLTKLINPEEQVEAVVEAPVLVILHPVKIKFPAALCANRAMPVVPKFPVQLFTFITELPLDEEKEIPVLFKQFILQLIKFKIDAAEPDTVMLLALLV